MSSREGTNYYELLEVSADAHSSEIHKAYQRAKQTYSQDNPALYSMFSPDEARELLRLIDEAFSVLNNPSSRKAYDESLHGGSAPPPVAHGKQPPQAQPQAPRTQQVAPPQTQAAHYPSQIAHQPEPTYVAPPSAPIAAQAPSSPVSDHYSIKPQIGRQATPPGQGRTSLSNYKIDEAFESEIAQATEFDGAFLQRIRLYKSISLEKMSEATRISRSYLSAVEASDYKSLPAAVFVRGFIVQMARQLGLEEQKVATSYIKAFKAGGGK